MEFLDWLQKEIVNNQFFSAALGGSVFYTVLNYGRGVVGTAYSKVISYFTREINVSNYTQEDIYNQLLDFISAHIKHPKNIEFKKAVDEVDEDYGPRRIQPQYKKMKSGVLKTNISYGNHWFFYNFYTIIFANISVEEHHANSKSDIIKIRIFSFRPRHIRALICEKFHSIYAEQLSFSKIYNITQYGQSFLSVNNRNSNSVFISGAIAQKIENSINSLTENEEIYERSGIKRMLGIMLYGPPGTGKTSYILGLAKKLNRSVYYFDSTGKNMEDKIARIASIPPNSFIVFEDIDCIKSFCARPADEATGETREDMPKLLKLLDGASLPDNTVLFATTNYIDKIDGAVKRFGRFDLHFELLPADKELATQMVNYIDPTKISLLEDVVFPVSQAELQARILKAVAPVVR